MATSDKCFELKFATNMCLGTEYGGIITETDRKKDNVIVFYYAPQKPITPKIQPFQSAPGIVIRKHMTTSKTSIFNDKLVILLAFDIKNPNCGFPSDFHDSEMVTINRTFISRLKIAFQYCSDIIMWRNDISSENIFFPIYEEGQIVAFTAKRWRCAIDDEHAAKAEQKRIESMKSRKKMEEALSKSKLWIDRSYLCTFTEAQNPASRGPTEIFLGDVVIFNFWIRCVAKYNESHGSIEMIFDTQNILIKPIK